MCRSAADTTYESHTPMGERGALCGLLLNPRVFTRSLSVRQRRWRWCGQMGMLVGIGRRMVVRVWAYIDRWARVLYRIRLARTGEIRNESDSPLFSIRGMV